MKTGTLAVKAGRDKTGSRNDRRASRRRRHRSAGDAAGHHRHLGRRGTFRAALDGNNRGDLVGERTLGRAGMQKLVQLPENRGLWLTYARYLTPSAIRFTARHRA